MYQRIVTAQENEEFMSFWDKASNLWGFFNKRPPVELERYFFLDSQNEKRGIIEFLSVNPEVYSVVTPYFPDFYLHPKTVQLPENTYEIGKLFFDPEHQKRGLMKSVFLVIDEHSRRNGAKYYVAAMEDKLFRLLTEGFGMEIESIGEPKVMGKITMHPVFFNVEVVKENPRVKRLLERYQTMNV